MVSERWETTTRKTSTTMGKMKWSNDSRLYEEVRQNQGGLENPLKTTMKKKRGDILANNEKIECLYKVKRL